MQFKAVLLALCSATTIAQAQVMVPGPGSIWESTLVFHSLREPGFQQVVRRQDEVVRVDRLLDGRPVFSGEVAGYAGELVQGYAGTVIATSDCKGKVPPAMYAPPLAPNQCGWHVCNAPPVGTTFTRAMIFYVPYTACEAKIGIYSFTAIGKESRNGHEVTVGAASVIFGPFQQIRWTSFIKDGGGEVFAQSEGRETNYRNVHVTTVPYRPSENYAGPMPMLPLAKTEGEELPPQCDLVAFGDSLTEGLGASKSESYPAQLGDQLGKTICNMGLTGSTTAIANERIPKLLALRPKVVFVALGANDAFRGIPPSQTKENLEALVTQLVARDVMVVVLSFESVAKSGNEYLRQMLTVYESLKDREGVIVLPDAFEGVFTPRNLSSDAMHPNALGYERLASNVMDQAFGLLRALSIR